MEEEYVEQNTPQPISNDIFNKAMTNELNREPEMLEEQKSELTDKLLEMKSNYANSATNKDKEIIETEAVKMQQKITLPEQFRKNLAGTVSDSYNFGHDPVGKLGEGLSNDIMDITNGNREATYEKGTPGYEMSSGEWMSFDQINELLSDFKVDGGSRQGIKTLLDDVVRKAEATKPSDNSDFNFMKEKNNIINKIIEPGNLDSLANDKMFGNRVFKNDLQSAIMKGTYKEMGIPDEQIVDPTPDGNISPEDAKIITSTIMQDKELLKNYVADYYTKALEQNHYNNLSPEVRNNKKIKTNKKNIEEQTKKPQSNILKGGTMNDKGIFIPAKK
tara:strand:+ start:1278 stop:2273 length:996 start_codon:yes stop_codon:yes gene_type:complete